jgi:hypothetical protein
MALKMSSIMWTSFFPPAEGEDEVAEDFPVVACLAGHFDGAVEALEAAGEVDHRAAFFGEGGGGQHQMGGERGGVGEDVGLEEEIEIGEVGEMESGVGDQVFAEHDEGFDLAGAHSFADRVEFGEGVFGFENEFRAGGVRVAVGGDEQITRPVRRNAGPARGAGVPISAASVRVRKSSSLVMRPEAMMAIWSGGRP